jgi:hypothetical protein
MAAALAARAVMAHRAAMVAAIARAAASATTRLLVVHMASCQA